MVPAFVLDGDRYPHGTRARYNAAKCRCFACRRANSRYEAERQADPRVPADAVRAHLLELSRQNIGRRAVSDATDIPDVALYRIIKGESDRIRRSQAERIMAVDASVIADHALVPATETRRLLREIIRLGFTRTSVAARLGSTAKVPTLQYTRGAVLAITERRVRRLHAELLSGEDGQGEDIEDMKIDDSPKARILRAIRFFERVTAQDLFESMAVADHDRASYAQTLHRMAKAGDVERFGTTKPFRYAGSSSAAPSTKQPPK
jgi:hypothetical protein